MKNDDKCDDNDHDDDKFIDKTVLNLVELLSKKDRSKIEETLARLRRELLDAPPADQVVIVTKTPQHGGGDVDGGDTRSPRPSIMSSVDESACSISVMDVRATQSSIAMHMTEASLYRQEADCIEQVLQRLAQAKLYSQEEWRHHVVKPVQESQQKLLESARTADGIAQQKLNDFLRLRKIANKGVASLMLQDERNYTEEFRLALRGSGLDAARELGVRMEEIQAVIGKDDGRMKKAGKKNSNHQPIPPNLKPASPDYLQWLRSQGQMILDTEFQSVANEIAQACNATAVLAPLKGYARTVQKAQEEYNGDYSRILDSVRGMIIFQDLPNCAKAVDMLAEFQNQGRLTIHRAKDRLSLFYNAAVEFGGYRDCLFNLSFPVAGGGDNNNNKDQNSYPIVCELQIQLQNFLVLKNEYHEHYEAARSIHMFNEAFDRRRFFWTKNTSAEEVTALLEDIEHGVLRELDLDYSMGLWSLEAQQRLANALKKDERALRTLSLRSCKCGDDFIRMCILPKNRDVVDDGMTSPPASKNHATSLGVETSLQVLRLGSLLHESTAGRISQQGVEMLLREVGTSIRILDLEGCLDLEGKENCGDNIVKAIVDVLQPDERKDNDDDTQKRMLLHLKELNLKSTGLTKNGLDKLLRLQQDGFLARCCFVTDVDP